MSVALVDVTSIARHPQNPRLGSIDDIRLMIQENGWVGVLVCQRSTRLILKGNNAYAAAVQLGYDRLPVEWRDVTDEEALVILAGDNHTSELGSEDQPTLARALRSLVDTTGTAGLDGSGWTPMDLRVLEAWEAATLPDGPRSGGWLAWGKVIVATTELEEKALLERIEDYRHEHSGELDGFVTSLLARAG